MNPAAFRYCVTCNIRVPGGAVVCPADGSSTFPVGRESDVLGRRIGDRYVLLEPLASGGMSTVYRAVQLAFERVVALKILRGGDDDDALRFDREARIASRLSNPHAVRILDFGRTDEGARFLVMEMIEGRSLASVIASDEVPMDPPRAVRIALQILDALDEAHSAGFLHRDVKPGNVLVASSTVERDFVKLVDFGLARPLEEGDSRITRIGRTAGTPAYMSPEQCYATGLDARTDLYAVGVVLFELLTGQLPHDDQSSIQLVAKKISRPAPRLGDVLTGRRVPADLSDLVAQLLEIDKAHRPASAAEVIRRLSPLAVEAAPVRIARPVRTPATRPATASRLGPSGRDAPELLALARAVALGEAARAGLKRAAAQAAEAVASRLLARLSCQERSLVATFRDCYESATTRPAPADLNAVLARNPPEPALADLLAKLRAGPADGGDSVRSAMEAVSRIHRDIAAYWAAQAGDGAPVFVRNLADRNRRFLDTLERLSQRLGIPGEDGQVATGSALSGDEIVRGMAEGEASSFRALRFLPDLLTGIPGIDAQHRDIFDLAARALSLDAPGAEPDGGHRLVTYLVSYADYHFAAEELTMKLFGYPGLDDHVATHARFRRNFERMAEKARSEGMSPIVRKSLLFQLASVLYHIRTRDRELARFLGQADPVDLPSDETLEKAGIRRPQPVD